MSNDARVTGSAGAEAWLRISAIVCFAVAALLWAGPDIARVDLFNGDAAHHIFWFYQYADPALFPDDLSLEYFTSGAVAPLGYRLLLGSIARVFDVLAAAEWLSVGLLAVSVFLAWMLGRAIAEREDGSLPGLLAAVALIVLLPQSDLLPVMAFQRTFAMPLTLLCLWALVAKRYRWVGIAWLGAALFYPIVIAVIGLAASIVFLLDLIRDRRMPEHWIWNGVLGVASIAIVLVFSTTPDTVGPSVSFEQAMTMAEFGPAGRQVLFGTDWNSGFFRHHRTGLGWSPWIMLLMVMAIAFACVSGFGRRLRVPVIVLGATGLLLWLAARLTLFDLYLPNRHSRYSLAALLIVVLAVAGLAALRTFAGLVWRDAGTMLRTAPGRGLAPGHTGLPAGAPGSAQGPEPGPEGGVASKRTAILAAVLAPFVVAVALAPHSLADWRRPVDTDLERTYEFLATLPKDSLIAAHPDLADYIPLRSKRSVLASTEAWIAFMQGYHARMTPRVAASLEAAYATSFDDVVATLAPYGVDVVVSADSVFAKDSYNPPLAELAAKLLAHGRVAGFALANPPAGQVLFRSGEYVVVAIPPAGVDATAGAGGRTGADASAGANASAATDSVAGAGD